MASRQARQERQLERQRGAGRRIKDLTIGLDLANQNDGQLVPQRSSRRSKTPHSDHLTAQRSSRRSTNVELRPQRSSKPTPKPQSNPQVFSEPTPVSGPSATRRSRARSNSTVSHKKRSRPPVNDTELDQPQTKRARIEVPPHRYPTDEDEAPAATTPGVLAAKDPNRLVKQATPGKKRKKRKSIGQNTKKPARSNERGSVLSEAHELHVGPDRLDSNVREQSNEEDPDQEKSISNAHASRILTTIEPTEGTGFTPVRKRRKKRVSIGQQSHRKAKSRLVAVKEESIENNDQIINHVPDFEENINDDVESNDEDDIAIDAQPVHQTKQAQVQKQENNRRKKRKSIGQQRPKRVVGSDITSSNQVQHEDEDQPPKFSKNANTRDDVGGRGRPPLHGQGHQHNKMTSRGRPRANAETSKPVPVSRAKTSKQVSASKPSKPNAGRPGISGIPITVYRPPSPVPSDEDWGMPIRAPITRKRGFNAVDVLAQINLERLTKIATKLDSQPDATRVKRKALGLYTNELESRLRHLSNALDANSALKTQFKRLGKEERELKKDMKEVEVESKVVKQRIKDLRSEKQRMQLESALRKIEKVARKGWQLERSTMNTDMSDD